MSSTTELTIDERYPEHAKQSRIKDKSQAIYDFLQFASTEGFTFGRTVTTHVAVFEGTKDVTAIQPAEGSQLLQLLARHFNIDLARIEAEKQQMLDELRAN